MKKGKNTKESYDLIVIGAGVAGLAAAMYAARLGMKTLVLGASHGSEMPIGGVITTTKNVENYPGFESISGSELAERIKKQAESYKLVEVREERVESVMKKEHFAVKSSKAEHSGKTILFSTGTMWRKLDIPGSKEFENKGVAYCALCQPPGEELIANSNIVQIEKITPSTKVLTSDGSYQNISGFTKRDYDGDLIRITPRFFTESVTLTPEHPVLMMRIKKGTGINYWRDFKFGEIEWKQAGNLTEEDCVLYPIIKETQDKESIALSDYLELRKLKEKVIPHKETHTAKQLPDKIKLSEELMRLFGYYLAEGSAVRHELRFYFRKDEKSYLDDISRIIKKTFGLEVVRSEKNNVGIVSLYSKIVCDLFKILFDKYSHAKRIPHFVMLLPQEKQRELIKGLWRGDGCIRDKDFCLVTSSRIMTYQVRDILLRLGIICSLEKIDKEKLNKKTHKIEGREVSFTKDKYHIIVGGQFLEKMSNILGIRHPKVDKRSKILKHAWLKDNLAILPIRRIEKIPYKGEVLSIAVENNANYVTKGFIVHNCDAPLFKNKTVAVIGGSDSAVKDALILAEYAKRVYILYRGDKVRAEPITLERAEKNEKIEIVNKINVTEIKGDNLVRKLSLDQEFRGSKELEVQGVFVAIGHVPLTELAKKLGIKLNGKGEIMINHKTAETSMEGVYAAGDVTDKAFKQAIIGVAEGCTAAYSAYEYLKKK